MKHILFIALLAAGMASAGAQDELIPAESPVEPPVQIVFTPPDLEGRFVMGIFDDAGALVRTLVPDRDATVFDVGLNGYITSWDGRDDAGTRCPGGKYAARGYVVGDTVEVTGEAFYFNDWIAEDDVRVTKVALREGNELALTVEVEGETSPRTAMLSDDGKLTWQPGTISTAAGGKPVKPNLPKEPDFLTAGRDGTVWTIIADGDQRVVGQFSALGESLRELRVPVNEPQPISVAASPTADVILLNESNAAGTQRVRLLRRASEAAAVEGDGQKIVDWEILFEREFTPCANFGYVEGELMANVNSTETADAVTVELAPSTLDAESQSLAVRASTGGDGTFLTAPDGLRLLPVSTGGSWNRVAMSAGKDPGTARLAQGDGLVVEAFVIKNLDQIAPFDCGTFRLAAAGENDQP